MIRIGRVRALIAITGMQVFEKCSYVKPMTLIIVWYSLIHVAGQDCRHYKDVSDGWSSVAVDSFIQSCCSLCGNRHDELRGCPCPRCLCWHPESDCFQFDVAMHRDAPCSRYGPCVCLFLLHFMRILQLPYLVRTVPLHDVGCCFQQRSRQFKILETAIQ